MNSKEIISNQLNILDSDILNDSEKMESLRGYLKYEIEKDTKKKENQKEGLKLKELKKIAESEFKTLIKTALGGYYQLNYNILNGKDIERQYKFRFLILADYIEDDNLIYYGNVKKYSNRREVMNMEDLRKEKNRLATTKDLKEIWRLGEDETRYTKNALVKADLIKINADKTITVNKEVARKFNIETFNIKESTRIFDNIQDIYKRATPREHKKLYLLIELLPYLNFNHNVICTKETTNEDVEGIKALSITKVAQLTGYKNVARFKKDLLDLTVNNELVAKVTETKYGKFIYINPKVYYRGNNIDSLQGVINEFRIGKK